MKKLMNFTMNNTLVVFLVVVILIGGGIYSASKVKMETMPDITIPMITTVTLYPGASPEDVAKSITEPMQKSISGIQGVDSVKTINDENVGIVVTQFDYNSNMDTAEKNVTDAVSKITLPSNAKAPTTSQIGFGSLPIMTYAVEGKSNINQLTDYINNKVTPKLSGVSGVSSVSAQGLAGNNVYIKCDPQKLSDNGLTITDVKNALVGNNFSMPFGQAQIDGKTLSVKADNTITSIGQLKSIPIVVPVNANAIVENGMSQLGSAVGQLGQGMSQMSQGMNSLAQAEGAIGNMVAGNTQAIGYLDAIQQLQMGILSQQAILANPSATSNQRAQAQASVTQLQKSLTDSQNALNKVLNDAIAQGKALASAQPSQGSGAAKAAAPSSAGTGSSAGSGGSAINVKVVFLSDLGEISTTSSGTQTVTRTNLKDGVILSVYKSDSANTVQVSNDIKSAIKNLSKDNSSVKFNPISDDSTNIKDSVNGMVREGLLGALFAILVIALFLRDFRATIIAVVSIPLSILIALIVMPRFGITLNIMSLGGIAVAVGRIVDDSIVIIENIYRRFSLSDHRDEELIKDAAAEVGSAVMSSTITTVGVFLPLSFVSGLIGKVFFSFAVTVVICIVASLLVAIVVVPVLSKKMLLHKKVKQAEKEGRIVKAYRKILSAALGHRAIVMCVSIAVFAVTLFFARGIPTQFLPSEDTNTLQGTLTMAPGTSEAVTNANALRFEKYLMSRSDIATVSSSVGDTSSSGNALMSTQGSNQASFTIVIKDGKNYGRLADEISREAAKLSGKDVTFQVAEQSLSGQSDNVEVDLYGSNADDLEKASDLVAAKMKSYSELTDVTNSASEKKPEIEVNVDAKKAADNGLSPEEVVGIVSGNLNSSMVTSIDNNGTDTSVYLGFEDQALNSLDAVKSLRVTGLKGAVKLSDVADVTQGYGPESVSELNGKQYVSVTATIKSKNTGKVTSEVMKAVGEMQLPGGVSYGSNGSSSQMNDAFSQMGLAMLIAILLVYMVMLVTFGDGKTPFAILLSLPFAAIGALLGLLITGQSLSVSGLIGMLMLIGIVVTNAIVLLDRVKHNRESGMTVREALIEAGGVRLRPIIMTALATVTALVPLALGFSEGALISQGLGIVVIGGLVVSTILTLIVVPVFYSILHRDKI